jgi:ribosomal protein S18 acetylase RimI-like enzyme
MSDSPLPSVPDNVAPPSYDLVELDGEPSWLPALIAEATSYDGQPPFSDQSLIELRDGTKIALAIGEVAVAVVPNRGADDASVDTFSDSDTPPAAEIEFVVAPIARNGGVGTAMLDGLMQRYSRGFRIWSHGNHPGARTLARSRRLAPVHTLVQLRARISEHATRMNPGGTVLHGAALHGGGVHDGAMHDAAESAESSGVTLTEFSPDADQAEWLEMYARVFAGNAKKPSVLSPDLAHLMDEEWFDPATFLIARDGAGIMVGFVWVKVHQFTRERPEVGEVYLLGVDPSRQSSGLGRILVNAGLELMVARNLATALLYVGGDNVSGLRLYHRAGFIEYAIDVQYESPPESELYGGTTTEVSRQSSSVVRSAGEWTETVHRYLHHLRNHGIDETPLPIAIDRLGRERLGFIEGDVAEHPFPEWVWRHDNLANAARLLRRIHDASLDFDTTGAVWQSPARTPAEVICHNYFAPDNFVGADGELVGVIDWDSSSPGPRLWDLAYLAYGSVPLTTASNTGADAATLAARSERTAALLAAYGDVNGTPLATVAELEYMLVQRLLDLAEFGDAQASVEGRARLAEHAALYRADAEALERDLRGQKPGD